MANCTWANCNQLALHPQIARDGEQWADLCDEHNKEIDKSIDDAISGGDVKAILSGWIKAQGGSKKATQRMMGGKTSDDRQAK